MFHPFLTLSPQARSFGEEKPVPGISWWEKSRFGPRWPTRSARPGRIPGFTRRIVYVGPSVLLVSFSLFAHLVLCFVLCVPMTFATVVLDPHLKVVHPDLFTVCTADICR
jgi:hypothetical protein